MKMVDVFKCRISAVTVLYVYGFYLMFYVPFCVTMIAHKVTGHSAAVKIAYIFSTPIILVNSFINPFVYCWRSGTLSKPRRQRQRQRQRGFMSKTMALLVHNKRLYISQLSSAKRQREITTFCVFKTTRVPEYILNTSSQSRNL